MRGSAGRSSGVRTGIRASGSDSRAETDRMAWIRSWTGSGSRDSWSCPCGTMGGSESGSGERDEAFARSGANPEGRNRSNGVRSNPDSVVSGSGVPPSCLSQDRGDAGFRSESEPGERAGILPGIVDSGLRITSTRGALFSRAGSIPPTSVFVRCRVRESSGISGTAPGTGASDRSGSESAWKFSRPECASVRAAGRRAVPKSFAFRWPRAPISAGSPPRVDRMDAGIDPESSPDDDVECREPFAVGSGFVALLAPNGMRRSRRRQCVSSSAFQSNGAIRARCFHSRADSSLSGKSSDRAAGSAQEAKTCDQNRSFDSTGDNAFAGNESRARSASWARVRDFRQRIPRSSRSVSRPIRSGSGIGSESSPWVLMTECGGFSGVVSVVAADRIALASSRFRRLGSSVRKSCSSTCPRSRSRCSRTIVRCGSSNSSKASSSDARSSSRIHDAISCSPRCRRRGSRNARSMPMQSTMWSDELNANSWVDVRIPGS